MPKRSRGNRVELRKLKRSNRGGERVPDVRAHGRMHIPPHIAALADQLKTTHDEGTTRTT